MLVSVNLFNRCYSFLIITPHCKVEDHPLIDPILHGCFNQVFSYKGLHRVWRIALSQHPVDAVIDPTGCL